jgi:hypothetical protein
MNSSPVKRYLTKSRFKAALECPTKLFYSGKPGYADCSADDEFLRGLAEGGFQVGELAKLMHPDGIEVTEMGHDAAVAHTAALLQQDNVTIFEAAIRFRNLFIRIDVLKKNGAFFELIEVKAKSYDPAKSDSLVGANGTIRSDMLPYLQDVAFQKFVLDTAYPGHTVLTFLMMVDKSAVASTNRISQRFKIFRDGHRSRVQIAQGTTADSIGASLLLAVPVSKHVDYIIGTPVDAVGGSMSFADAVVLWAAHYESDQKIQPVLGAHCARCEFKMPVPETRSGFHECWKQATGWEDSDFAEGTVLDLWNFRNKDALIRQDIFKLRQVTKETLGLTTVATRASSGMSRGERQWLQVSGQWPGRSDFYLDHDGLRGQVSRWRYPLHFIDFETSRTALPFHKGRRPYEQVAFQFSHHLMMEDGHVVHAGQFLEATPGVFPNYAFTRELRRQLAGDNGTILRWATHENSVLRDIWTQLENDPAPPADKEELQAFILSITTDGKRVGDRTMVDLCKMTERYYFHPMTKGSCSIKKVLPAVLSSSAYLRQRYAANSYGSRGGIRSSNFKDWAWWQPDTNSSLPRDPYTLLPAVFADIDSPAPSDQGKDEALANGGAAMAAYGRLQFETISDQECRHLEAALLKYCELDTLAMIMIFQSWQAELANDLTPAN